MKLVLHTLGRGDHLILVTSSVLDTCKNSEKEVTSLPVLMQVHSVDNSVGCRLQFSAHLRCWSLSLSLRRHTFSEVTETSNSAAHLNTDSFCQ